MNQLNRALKILATCKPEVLAKHTFFTVELCREAIETAQQESIRAAATGEGGHGPPEHPHGEITPATCW